MKKYSKRGQASIDFLTTYGWAIMIMIAAIGSLGYIYLADPSDLTPQICSCSEAFTCNDNTAESSSGKIRLNLKNSAGTEVQIDAVGCTLGGQQHGGYGGPATYLAGVDFEVGCNLGGNMPARGDPAPATVRVKYKESGLNYDYYKLSECAVTGIVK